MVNIVYNPHLSDRREYWYELSETWKKGQKIFVQAKYNLINNKKIYVKGGDFKEVGYGFNFIDVRLHMDPISTENTDLKLMEKIKQV